MTAIDTGTTRSRADGTRKRQVRRGSVGVIIAVLVLAIVIRGWLAGLLSSARLAAVATVFISVVLQALPFLVAGIVVAALVREFVSARFVYRWLRRRGLLERPYVAVPVAALAAVVPPRPDDFEGMPAPVAFAHSLAASAISPVVLVATAVAFPGHPMVVLARAVAGLVVAMAMGWLWQRFGRPEWIEQGGAASTPEPVEPAGFWADTRVEVIRAGGVLAVGGLLTALLTVAAPPGWTRIVADRSIFSVVALALLAVLVCIPAEAGPAVAACLSPFSLTARLVFLVVGPVVNLLRFSRQSIVYGPSFAVRFAPATLVVATAVTSLVAVLL